MYISLNYFFAPLSDAPPRNYEYQLKNYSHCISFDNYFCSRVLLFSFRVLKQRIVLYQAIYFSVGTITILGYGDIHFLK
ncbi:ion channel [Pseudocolwellia agarivorans]|uniref:ion channel n=1 Tax=Pseudocolwellia agarivorans TaxID=1911682 RepID=UPI003CCC2F92